MMKSKWNLAGKPNNGLPPGVKGIPISTAPRKFIAIPEMTLKQSDFPGSGMVFAKSIEEAIIGAEGLASGPLKGQSFYIVEVKQI